MYNGCKINKNKYFLCLWGDVSMKKTLTDTTENNTVNTDETTSERKNHIPDYERLFQDGAETKAD